MPNVDFDFGAFLKAIDSVRVGRRTTWRKIADETGINASSLTRLQQGKRLGVDSVGALARWGGLNADDYFGPPADVPAGHNTQEELVALLRATPQLTAEGSEMLQRMIRAAYQVERSKHDE